MTMIQELKPTSIINFNDNQLINVRKSIGYDDNKLEQDVVQFDDWIRKQNHFKIKEFDRGFLERYLIYSKGSIEKAKRKFDRFCTFNNLMPEFLRNFDIRNEFVHLHNICHTSIMPTPTSDNYRVLITNVSGHQDEEWNITQYYRYLVVMSEYILYNDYCLGYELIADPRGASLSIVKKLNPIIIHKALTMIVEAFGQRMKKIHIIASDTFFEAILLVFKTGLTGKLSQRLVVHNTLESLYEHVPKSILPKDLGGDERSMKEISELDFKELSTDEHIARVKYLEEASVDESLRLPSKFNEEYSGTPGSFKTLCVD